MFKMLKEEGIGLRLTSPLSHTQLHIAGMAFVDDTDTLQTDTVEDVLRLAQGNVDHWEGAIRATGGALDPKKTHWHVIDFQWTQGLWSYSTMGPNNILTMLDTKGKKVTIQQLPVS